MVAPASEAVWTGPSADPYTMRTLAWTIMRWCQDYLRIPDGAHAGQPWKFTLEQARFLAHWYAINEAGEFVYNRGTFRRMKGHGKDPLGAVLCAIEFLGPCRYLGDDPDGYPIGIPVYSSWVQTAAVSREQTRNTMSLFPGLFSDELRAIHGISDGKEIIYAKNGLCRIEAVTSSPRAAEGNRTTFTLKNETHHWLQNNEGLAMSEVIARNAAKMNGRVLGISNAHQPGEMSDAEQDHDAYLDVLAGRTDSDDFLYDSLEAPPDIDIYDDASLLRGLRLAAGDSWWVPVERLLKECRSPRTKASDIRRYYLNQIYAAEDAWLSRQEWDVLALPGYQVPAGAAITLGFDGSKTDDHTALLGLEIATGHLFTLGVWDPERSPGGEVPRDEINGAVRRAFETYDVVGFYADVHPWESYIDTWAEDLGDGLCVKATMKNPIGWDMRGRQREATFMVEAFYEDVIEAKISHDNDPRVNQHVYNARRAPNQWGVTIRKENRESARKIDAAATAALARQCARDYQALPQSKKRRRKTGVAHFY